MDNLAFESIWLTVYC